MPLRTTQTKYGAVQGVPCGNPTYTVFRGIPYGAPTDGENRFSAPKPPKAWEGVRMCDTFSDICMQASPIQGLPFGDFFLKEFYPYRYQCSEDSLCLNVWTPAQSSDEKLPVMVWIHGGGFGSGYGHEMEFDGEALCKAGVILVTINYRLNFFGFFAHPELSAVDPHGVSGNYGILDQIAALRWVQENIGAFGGDKDNVTIFGQSAGGASIIAHLISDLSEGLFHKAIIQSGTFTLLGDMMMGTREEGEQWGQKACEYLGKTVEELRAMPLEEANAALEEAQRHIGPAPKLIVDGYVFKERPLDALKSGQWKNVPTMSGSVRGDKDLSVGRDKELKAAGIDPTQATFMGDAFVGLCQAENGRTPAYIYLFDPEIPGHDIYHFVEDGLPYHSAELWYIFGTLDRCWRDFSGGHYELSKLMIQYWTNFAKYSDPNGCGAAQGSENVPADCAGGNSTAAGCNGKSSALPAWPAFTKNCPKRMYLSEKGSEIREIEELPAFMNVYNK